MENIISSEYLHLSDYENIKKNLSKSKFEFVDSYQNINLIETDKQKQYNLRINKKCSIQPFVNGKSFVYRINSGIYT